MPASSRWTVVVFIALVCPLAAAQQNSTSHEIHRGAKVFIEKMDGFEEYVIAALHSKRVPLTVVVDKDKADFTFSGSAESNGNHVRATLKAVNKNGEVVFACSFDDEYTLHGKQSAAESCAKKLKKDVWE
jgi:TolB-like protein